MIVDTANEKEHLSSILYGGDNSLDGSAPTILVLDHILASYLRALVMVTACHGHRCAKKGMTKPGLAILACLHEKAALEDDLQC